MHGSGELLGAEVVLLAEVELGTGLDVLVEARARGPPEPGEDLELLERRRYARSVRAALRGIHVLVQHLEGEGGGQCTEVRRGRPERTYAQVLIDYGVQPSDSGDCTALPVVSLEPCPDLRVVYDRGFG